MKSTKGIAKTKLFIESLMIFLIILAPFIFKSHEYVSEDPEASLNLFGFIIDNNGFPNLQVYIWYLLGKLIPFYLLIIWFFTSKQWWYHIILIPICMYAFQLFENFYSDNQYIDTKNALWILPVCMVIIPIVYFIRIKLYDKHVNGIDLEAMDAELKMLQEKERLRKEKEELKSKKL
ncbi:hypothetical protein [Sediminicola sp. 1XM1-17]|uniref:hypothetical protein n=1 Tax=Sediminicola sp. 1XM1-17 TaxID=3127702 RepID=UPI00307729D1